MHITIILIFVIYVYKMPANNNNNKKKNNSVRIRAFNPYQATWEYFLSEYIGTPWCKALKDKNFIFQFPSVFPPCFAAWFAVTRINGGVALSLSWATSTRLLVNILYWSILIFTLPCQNLLWLFAAIWTLSYQSAECSSEYFKLHWIRHAFEQLDKQCADDNTAFTNALNNFAT